MMIRNSNQIISRLSKFAFILFIVTYSCSPNTINLVPKASYQQTNNLPIYISTIDTVYFHQIHNNQKVIFREKLNKIIFSDYFFQQDTLFFKLDSLKAAIPLSSIESIKIHGICDDELGAISDEEFSQNRSHKQETYRVLGGMLGGLSGFVVAKALREQIGFSLGYQPSRFFAITGALAGMSIGYKKGYFSDKEHAIEKIKQKNKEKD